MRHDPDTLQRFRNAIRDDKATFIFVPSALLKEKLLKGDDPILNSLPKGMAEHLLSVPQGGGIATDANLVLKYLEGTLDPKNAHLLSLGEIRVCGVGDMMLKPKSKESDSGKGGIILP